MEPLVREARSVTPRKSFSEVWLITIGHGFTHWYPATFYLLLPLIGKQLGLNYSEIGFIISFQYIVSSISNLPGGMLVDFIRRKSILMGISLFWVGVPYFFMSFTHSYWLLLLCVGLVGIGNNLWHPSAIPTLSQRFSDRKGLVLSFHGMGANIGNALAPLMAGWLLGFMSWRRVVQINVVPGLIMGVIILIFLRHLFVKPKEADGGEKDAEENMKLGTYLHDLGKLLRNRSLLLLSTSSTFRSMSQNALYTFLPLYLSNVLGLSPGWMGASIFVLEAAGFIAAPISGHLSDKMGRKRIIMFSLMVCAVVLVFMAVAGHSLVFIVFISILGFFLYAVRPVMQAWLMESTPKRMAGTSVGALFGLQSLGSSFSPLIGGLFSDHYGLFAAFYFIAGTVIISNLLIFFMPTQSPTEQN